MCIRDARLPRCPFPAFRSVNTAFTISSFDRSDDISAVDELSIRLMIFSSWTAALPDAPPALMVGRACMPHDHPSTSISPLWASSCALDDTASGAFDTEKHVAGAVSLRRVVG
jgi:hypothetical protein